MGGLQKFEQRLENLISGAFAKAFRSAVQPVEIAAALQRECDNKAQILSRDRRFVPNDFHVELSQPDLDRLAPYDTAMAGELTDQLLDHADAQGYVFPGPVRIRFESADDLTTGRFRIRSQAQAKVTERDAGPDAPGPDTRMRAVLDINGSRHRLRPPRLVVGRGAEADVRINDPGVSRQHAEFLMMEGGSQRAPQVEVHDMGSTNGVVVDGRKVPRATLRDGARIRIGNTDIVLHLEEGGRDV